MDEKESKTQTKKSRTIREKNQVVGFTRLGMKNKLVQTNFGLSKKISKRNEGVDYL